MALERGGVADGRPDMNSTTAPARFVDDSTFATAELRSGHPDLFEPLKAQPFQFDRDAFGARAESDPHTGRLTMAARLASFFRQRPDEWIDGDVLAGICGRYAWRTRVSDIRRAPYLMNVVNQQRRVGHATVSEYKYLPAPPADLGGAA